MDELLINSGAGGMMDIGLVVDKVVVAVMVMVSKDYVRCGVRILRLAPEQK